MNSNQVVDFLKTYMASSPLHNYVIAGLTSQIIGEGKGRVRLFSNTRKHQDAILPHSHRYHLMCTVISGQVKNHTWTKDEGGDLFQEVSLNYQGEPGKYDKMPLELNRYVMKTKTYNAGETYLLSNEEIHSINFSKGAQVLVFESEPIEDYSIVLVPCVNGQPLLEMMETRGYMFQSEEG